MAKFQFDIRIFHSDGESNLKAGTDISKWIDIYTQMYIENLGISEGGMFQFVKKANGAALHLLSSTNLDWEYILTITPVYPTDTKIQEIQKILNCVD